MSTEDDKGLFVGEGFAKLPKSFVDGILTPVPAVDTSDDNLRRLPFRMSGPPRLATSNGEPTANNTKAALSTVAAPLSPFARSLNPAHGFLQQVGALVAEEQVSARDMAEAMFRVNLTGSHPSVDYRKEADLTPRDKLAIDGLAGKFARRTAPARLEEATCLAIWRGAAQPLRY